MQVESPVWAGGGVADGGDRGGKECGGWPDAEQWMLAQRGAHSDAPAPFNHSTTVPSSLHLSSGPRSHPSRPPSNPIRSNPIQSDPDPLIQPRQRLTPRSPSTAAIGHLPPRSNPAHSSPVRAAGHPLPTVTLPQPTIDSVELPTCYPPASPPLLDLTLHCCLHPHNTAYHL